MSRLGAKILCGFGVAGAGVCGPAWAQRLELVPFAEITQVGQASLSGGATDSVTYTDMSSGLVMRTNTRRIVASLGYRASYRIAEAGPNQKSFQQNGEGRFQMEVFKNILSLDAGVLATQSRVDAGGSSQQFNSVSNNNLTQTYAFYAQPTTRHHFGDLNVIGSYRYGYVINEGKTQAVVGPPTNRFDSSMSHTASLQTGMGIGTLPFEWGLSTQYQLENTNQLDQRFRNYNASLEVKQPIGDTVAAVASAGYESNHQAQDEALVDTVTGIPVTDKDGRFLSDKSKPRKLIYEQDGFIADAGVIWRPSRRTRVEARVGRRYGGLTYSGLVEMKPDDRSTLNIAVTDRINSFGRAVTGGLAGAPAQLDFSGNDPQTAYQTCLFGVSGNGSCIGGALGQAAASSYRDRSVTAIYSHTMRRLSFNFGGGYTRRTYIDDPTAPFSMDGIVDQLFYLQGAGSVAMARDSGLSFALSANLFKNGQAGVGDVISYSLSSSYYRLLGRGLRADASLGLESSKRDGFKADMSGRAQLGVHYDF